MRATVDQHFSSQCAMSQPVWRHGLREALVALLIIILSHKQLLRHGKRSRVVVIPTCC